jgi:hypothetical protein
MEEMMSLPADFSTGVRLIKIQLTLAADNSL